MIDLKEKIAIVDKDDKVIGSATKPEVWEQGHKHRIVHVMVEDHKGRLLLQKRSANMKLYPNHWGHSAGGHVDKGESYDQAARRELFEEIGIKADEMPEVGYYYNESEFNGRKLNRFTKVFKCTVADTPKQLETEEVASVRWFTLDEIKQLLEDKKAQVTDGLRYIITHYY